MIVCSGFYSYFVCFSLPSVFYSIAFCIIAFSLTRSDVSAGNSLSVPQYTAVAYHCFILTACLHYFSVFLQFTVNKMMMMMMMMMMNRRVAVDRWALLALVRRCSTVKTVGDWAAMRTRRRQLQRHLLHPRNPSTAPAQRPAASAGAGAAAVHGPHSSYIFCEIPPPIETPPRILPARETLFPAITPAKCSNSIKATLVPLVPVLMKFSILNPLKSRGNYSAT